jgi:hypothetical protein
LIDHIIASSWFAKLVGNVMAAAEKFAKPVLMRRRDDQKVIRAIAQQIVGEFLN